MAYTSLHEAQRAVFLAALGLTESDKSHNELMYDYLFLLGYTQESLYDRVFAYAVDNDIEIGEVLDTIHLDGVAPTAPSAPVIDSAVGGNTTATISFSPQSSGGSPVTQFTVTSSPGGLQGTGLSSPIVVSGLTNGTPYTFTMTATNDVGTSGASNVSNSVTPAVPPGVPGQPTSVVGTRGNGQVSVAFSAPSSDGGSAITSYTAVSDPGAFTNTGASSPIVVSGLTNGESYTFTVTATNAVGPSAPSAESAAVIPATVPSAPTMGTATHGNGDASITFTANSDGGSAVTVFTATSSPGGITAQSPVSPVVVPGLTNGTPYTFTITATNSVGTSSASAASNSVTPNPPAGVPSPPLSLVATRGNGQASVAFTTPVSNGGSAITGYTVTSSPGGLQGTGASSPIVVTGLTNGTSYTFTAVATNAIGSSNPSVASAAVVPATVPSAPTIGTAVATNAQATVSFTANGNGGEAITGFTATSNPGALTASGSASPLTITGLTNNVSYTFTVTAENAIGVSPPSGISNSVTPNPPTPNGPFDQYYAADFNLNDTNTFVATPSQSLPAKATGFADAGYVEPVLGTRVYRMASTSDIPSSTVHARHEYARRQPFNCDSTKYFLKNPAGYFFVFNTADFSRVVSGRTTAGSSFGAVGNNSFAPADPCEIHWHATDPNKIIFTNGSNGGLVFREFDVNTNAVTTKFDLTGRLGAFGMGTATRVTTHGEGRPSDDGRYWGFSVFNGSTWLGIITYDMQTDTIIAGRAMTGTAPNNVTMSPNGNYMNVSSFESSLTFAQCQNAGLTVQRGSRCYPKDLNSFVQVHCTSNHSEMAVDVFGNDVFVGFHYEGSRMPDVTDGSTFYRRVDTGQAYVLWDLYGGAGGGHVSSCGSSGQPGWVVFSTYRTTAEATWRDEMVILQELRPTGAKHLRAAHTMGGWTSGDYWAEPHATVSRDGLKVVFAALFPGTTTKYAMMVGLPSWAYGGVAAPGSAPSNTVIPAISQDGSTLTSTTGSWNNSPSSYAYQWQREDAGPVWTNVGSNSNTHSIGDYTKNYRVTVTATNAVGSAQATSNSFDPADPSTDLVSNGTFATDTVWTKGLGWTISGGTASRSSQASTSVLSQPITFTPGTTYRIGVLVNTNTGGNAFRVRLTGGTTSQSGEIYSTGQKEVDLVANSGNNTLEIFSAQAGLVINIDNVTCTQYSQPAPGSGPELVTNGGFATDTSWTKGTGWTISGGVATHSGSTGNLDQAITLSPGTTYRILMNVSGYSGISAIVPQFTGGSTVSGQEIRTNGAKHFDLVAVSGNNNFRLSGAGAMSFDNISIRAL